MASDEKRSVVDEIIGYLEADGYGTPLGYIEKLPVAREELRALRAENARLREALLSLTEAGCPCSDCTRARTALASKEDRRG